MARFKRIQSILLWCSIVFCSIVLLEILFRVYEGLFLQGKTSAQEQQYDLRRMGYNESKILPASKKINEYRILSFGDSFAAAPTLPQYAYSHITQERLNQTRSRDAVTVYNLGVAGISFPNYIEHIRFWDQAVDYDAILLNLYAGNDFTDFWSSNLAAASIHSTERLQLRYGLSARIPSRYPLRVLDYGAAIWFSYFYSQPHSQYRSAVLHLPSADYTAYQRHASHVYQINRIRQWIEPAVWLHRLLRFLQERQQEGKKVYVFISHPHFFFSPDYYRQVLQMESIQPGDLDPLLPGKLIARLRERLRATITVDDLYPVLTPHAQDGKELYYGTNTHWNVEGNRIVGEYLAKALSEAWFSASRPSDVPTALLASASEIQAAGLNTLIETAQPIQKLSDQIERIFSTEPLHSQEERQRQFEQHGFHHQAKAFEGALEFINESPVGHYAVLNGWAWNPTSPDQPLLIAAFFDHQPVGIGITKLQRDDVLIRYGMDSQYNLRPGFSFMIQKPAAEIQTDRLELAVLTLDQRFAWLELQSSLMEEATFVSRNEAFAEAWFSRHAEWVGDHQFQITRLEASTTTGEPMYRIQPTVADGNIRDMYLAQYLDGLQPGKTYTLSFHYRYDRESSSNEVNNHIQAAVRGGDHRSRKAIADIEDYEGHRRPHTIRVDPETFGSGKVHTFTSTFTLPEDETALTFMLIVRFQAFQADQNALWLGELTVQCMP